jgi:8-oxo-dGTP diphosphatase
MTHYVVGFAFNEDGTSVVLIKKNKPAWQAGKFNGVGGKIEEGETPAEAMVREFKEETGVDTLEANWTHFSVLNGEDCSVNCFCTFDNASYNASSCTSEYVCVVRMDYIKEFPTIPNLAWLIPMALQTKTDPNFGFAGVRYLQ